jgi:hypothetical protein
MDDKEILGQIQRLVDEEHGLLHAEAPRELSADERARLDAVQVSLDQCWDLLRQRRARREFGENPDDAQVRDATTVERFQQ